MVIKSMDSPGESIEPIVTIIVPTLASTDRKTQLLRAVQSALDAASERINVIVCVNGNRWSTDSIAAIESIP